MNSIKKYFLLFIPTFPSTPTKQCLQIEINNAIITTLTVIYYLLFNSEKYLEFRSRSKFYENNKLKLHFKPPNIKDFLGTPADPLLARAKYSTIAK